MSPVLASLSFGPWPDIMQVAKQQPATGSHAASPRHRPLGERAGQMAIGSSLRDGGSHHFAAALCLSKGRSFWHLFADP